MTNEPTNLVPLTDRQLDDLTATIESAHMNMCISSDNCDCYELIDYLASYRSTAQAIPPRPAPTPRRNPSDPRR